MVKNVTIRQIHTDSLSCEPILRRVANGELLCVSQCGGVTEPAIENRMYAFHSSDNGKTWRNSGLLVPENGRAIYNTEVTVEGDEITCYISHHLGGFIDWQNTVVKSWDNGYTWQDVGPTEHFTAHTFVRTPLKLSNGDTLTPYHTYPITREEEERILREEERKGVFSHPKTPHCETGVVLKKKGETTSTRIPACFMSMEKNWIWSEPTLAELSDGTVVMLMRRCFTGWLWRTESKDGGLTWSEVEQTDIPNPSNKPKLIKLDKGRIALIHTPNNTENMRAPGWGMRWPLELWISDDDMKTWKSKTCLTNFPGNFSYTDGFYEDGHILFTIEHNRHTILFFDVELA